ncbi:MAG TPA: hypothetical protein VFH20_14275 [Propionibacteriaceae bacterium]|nr:hypothetical protein [Propionibacteriaceae bacterium]
MTSQRVGDRSGIVRRRAVRRTVVRALLTSAALVVLYYGLPMTERWTPPRSPGW